MFILRAVCCQTLAVLVTIATAIRKQTPSIAEAGESSLQPRRSLRLSTARTQNASIATPVVHSADVHRVLVADRQNASAFAGSNSTNRVMSEASALQAARKHDRFCEEFCYHQYEIDNKAPTQLLRMPCKEGCLRMYSQGAMGFCDCDPLDPPQDPKGGPLKQGSRGGCYTFPDPGQGWKWHASCLDLFDKNHGVTADQPGFQTADEVKAKIIKACEIGWQCGSVMAGCVKADTLSVTYPLQLIGEVCTR